MLANKVEGWSSLHPKQQKLYEMLLQYKDESASLTLDAMREELDVSSINTVVHHIKQLEKKGYIRRKGEYGEIEVLPAPVRDIVYLNLYGTVGCAPTGFFNDGNVIERIPFPVKQLRVNADSFLVEARGDSMEPLIHENDLVLVNKTNVIANGDTAVVVHDGEAKLKKFYKEGSQVILQSLNSKYDPVVVKSGDIHVVGSVSGVVRSFSEN